MLSPEQLKTHRAFIRAVKGLSVETQEAMAKAAKCGVIYRHGEFGKSQDARALWINSLRPGDEAKVARLDVLVRPRSELGNVRVSVDLATCLASIAAKGATVVDMSTGITSRDGERWANLVETTLRRSHMAQRSQRKISASLAKARAARPPIGLQAKWLAPAMEKERRKAQIIWQSAAFTSDEEAQAALPEELQATSLPTVRRILGGRRPSRKGMGGRPKVKTQRK
jgi:hypothetical protein